jgi:hypothetical protein
VIPWDHFESAVAEAKGLARDDGPDYLMLAAANHALLRRAGPLFLEAFEFKGAAAVAGFLRAVAAMRLFYAGNRRTLPKDIPTDFIRRSWRPAVFRDGVIDGPAYELCLFAELRDRLRAGDVWVVGSRQYRAVEDQLIPKPLFAEMRAAGPLPVAVPLEAAGYLRERKALLATRLREVADKAGQDRLTDVRLTGDTLKITPLAAETPQEAKRLADRVYALLPRVRITDLLDEVAQWTGIADSFTHLRTGRPAEDRRVVLTAVLAHGTDIKIAVHHTDGGGVSDHVFALCHLLGFRFAPRIPNLHDRRLYAFGPAATWPTLEPFIAGRIDETLIQTHWEELLRLATSVRTGTVPASLMLKRLGSYPRQNGLSLALREVGRIEADAVHPRLAGRPGPPAPGDGRAEQGRIPQRPGPRRLLPPPRPHPRPDVGSPAAPRQRPQFRRGRHHPLEHRLHGAGHRFPAGARRAHSR